MCYHVTNLEDFDLSIGKIADPRNQRTRLASTLNSDSQFKTLGASSTYSDADIFRSSPTMVIVVRIYAQLPENLRTVALLRELQGLSNAETALRLGLTVTAVKARTFHARRYLRAHLEGKCTAPRIDFSRRCIGTRSC